MCRICRWICEWIGTCRDAEQPDSRSKPDREASQDNLSPQALARHRSLFDQVGFLKKQQWTLTNYVLIIYGGIFAVGRDLSLLQQFPLIFATIAAATYGIYLLHKIQCDLGNTRVQLDKADLEIFGKSEYAQLGMGVDRDPYKRGVEFTCAMVFVLGVGALLLALYLLFSHHSS